MWIVTIDTYQPPVIGGFMQSLSQTFLGMTVAAEFVCR